MKKITMLLIIVLTACVLFSCGKTETGGNGAKPGDAVQSNNVNGGEKDPDATEAETEKSEKVLKNGDLLFSSKYMVEEFTGESFIVSNKTGNLMGVIDTDGEIIIPVEYDDVEYIYSDEGEPYYTVEFEEEKTLFDSKGEKVCDFTEANLGEIEEDRVFVKRIVTNHIILAEEIGGDRNHQYTDGLMNFDGELLFEGRTSYRSTFPSDAAESGALSYFTIEDFDTIYFYFADSETGDEIDTIKHTGDLWSVCRDRYAMMYDSTDDTDDIWLIDIITGETLFNSNQAMSHEYVTPRGDIIYDTGNYRFLNRGDYLSGETDTLYFAADEYVDYNSVYYNLHSIKDGVVAFISYEIDDIDQYKTDEYYNEDELVAIDGCDFYNDLLKDKEVTIKAHGNNNVLYFSNGTYKLADMKTGDAVAENRYNDINDESIDGYILETFEGEYCIVNKNLEIVASPGEVSVSYFDEYDDCIIHVNGKNVKNYNDTSYSEASIPFTFSIDDYMIVAIPSDSEDYLLDFVILNGKN